VIDAFTREMTVGAALDVHPHARWVFAAYHLNGCTNCVSRVDETLAEVGEAYGISVEKLLADLNSLTVAAQNR
jgi:hybrid cluster-associated redox disulfide protein